MTLFPSTFNAFCISFGFDTLDLNLSNSFSPSAIKSTNGATTPPLIHTVIFEQHLFWKKRCSFNADLEI